MSPFVRLKVGYFQQHLEHLNQQLQDELAALGETEKDKDKSLLLFAEHERLLKDVRALYAQPTGVVLAMGSDDCLALGIAKTEDDDKLDDYPPTLTRNIPDDIVQVAAGGFHSAALSEKGEVYTWGCNDDYALGRQVSESDMHKAGKVDLADVTRIDAGDIHTIYLTKDGRVFMTGMYRDMDSGNKFANVKPGQKLKKGLSQKDPVEIPFPGLVFKIAAGHSSNGAILEDGSLYTWGEYNK
jgi:regulator of chromosome condensation